MEENTEQRVDLTLFSEKIQELKDRIASVIVGQEQTVDLVLTAILANGHVLIEGVPGVAKTLLARLTARLIDADFSRVQFTPDLMPSDVLGTTVFNMKTNGFDFHQPAADSIPIAVVKTVHKHFIECAILVVNHILIRCVQLLHQRLCSRVLKIQPSTDRANRFVIGTKHQSNQQYPCQHC